MSKQHTGVTPESIMAEFPAVTAQTADDLADRIQETMAAANVLNILRSCQAEAVEQAIGIITEQMDSHEAELQDDPDPTEGPNLGDSLWHYEDGFTEIRTKIIKMACTALDRMKPETISEELERLDPWICQIDTMQIKPRVLNWQDCIDQSQLWQQHVINRDYDANTADLLGSPDGKLAGWNSLIGAHKLAHLIIVPIQSQEELATEAALNDPTIYPRYIHKCIANTARPFVVFEDQTGNTRTLCVLRRHKGSWKVATPTWREQDQTTIDLLNKFAKTYRAFENEPGPKAHRSGRRPPGEHTTGEPASNGRTREKTATAHRCQRCDGPENPGQTQASNTPGRCNKCWTEYHEKAGPQPEPSTRSRSCAGCNTKPAEIVATAGKRDVRICATCELISREYTIYEHVHNVPLKVVACRGCGSSLTRLNYEQTCEPCKIRIEQEQRHLQAVITYLYDVLDARREGKEADPDTPQTVRSAARSDMTALREDARASRLTPALSVELCREYVLEGRHVPELALRFGVSIETVRKTLRGQSWKNHTEDHRPARLREEPARIRPPKPPESQQAKPAYITVSRLKSQFGWTDRLIAKHLKGHDKEAPNPHYTTAAPMRLYLLDRVQAVTAAQPSLQTELQNTIDRRTRLSQTQQDRTLARRAELLAQAEKLEPAMLPIPSKDAPRLMELAAEARKQFLAERWWYDDHQDRINSETARSEESAVNMVRHEYTNYETLLETMPHARDVGTNIMIYNTLKRKTLEMIAENIPQLRAACEHQISTLEIEHPHA